MGRSFESVRQGVKSIADRWARSSRALRFSRESVNTGTMQDSDAMRQCLARFYYFTGESGDNKKEKMVSVWCH